MPMLWLKRWFSPASETQRARIVCAAVIAALLTVMCGSAHADAETPVLNTSGPSTFHGEIAKGLKIEMRLYQEGPSFYGTYSYQAFGRDIQVKGTINERGKFALQEFVKGKVTGNFEGKFVTVDRIEGRWFKKSPRDKGRSFYAIRTGAPLAATQVLPTQKTSSTGSETSPAAKAAPIAPKAEAAARVAPTAESRRSEPLSSARQQSAPVAREVPLPQQEKKIEAKALPVERTVASQQQPLKIEPAQSVTREEPVLLPAVAQEPPKVPVKAEAQSAEKPRIEGRTVDPVKKKDSPWTSFLSIFNVKVAGGVGGILLLGGGLAWLAVVAGGAAAFRDNSALFRRAHAMGLSFLPGIFMLAVGVGAVLAVFVE